jgi:light-harvesting complex I chlorophyll a/b binding protein 3
MASFTLARGSVASSKVAFSKGTSSPCVRKSLVCRAEEKSVAKVDRSKDVLHFTSESALTYLDGTLPGDFGFDPLGLLDPKDAGGYITPDWLRYAEVFHGRWAMLGAAGCIAPEILGSMGLIPKATGIDWFAAGVIPPAGTYDQYWTDPYNLFFVEIVLMSFAEHRRIQDFRNPGSMGKQDFLGMEASFAGSGDPCYPGGPFFNLFNLGRTESEMKNMKQKEIKNGRLAMIAILGYGAQATMTREGPFQNLLDHLADPVNNNMVGNFGKVLGSI